jgi:CubicO group peptidase (beta-lactamase class C family)
MATEGEALESQPWRSHHPALDDRPPTMLSLQEIELLHWLAAEHYTGQGTIIDAGCFLGGSTHALAAGLRANRRSMDKRGRIHSFDRFELQPGEESAPYITPFAELRGVRDFRANWDRHTARYRDHVQVHHGDILQQPWTGEPVEILFVDIAKTPAVNQFVMESFFPRLIPGRSILVHQDYLWYGVPWINISMEVLAPHFVLLDSLPAASNVYLAARPISREQVAAFDYRKIPAERKIEMMDRVVARAPEPFRGNLALSRAQVLASEGLGHLVEPALREIALVYERDPRILSALGSLFPGRGRG